MENHAVNAIGVWFYAMDTQRYLYLLRDDPRHPDTWGLPGGKIESGETMLGAMQRECQEELGFVPEYIKLTPLEKFTSADSIFAYHTFFCSVTNEFVPCLNDEHTGWAWIASGRWPKPMHPGLWSTVNFDAVRDKIRNIESTL
jgi:8-oxo-dGTP pyrophosphatase MutT (NUDIX family)